MESLREAMVGWGAFAAFFAGAVTLGAQSGSVTIRAFSFIVGLGGGGATGVLAALAAHLAREPAEYEPIEGQDGAWGLMEFEEAGGEPPR